MTKELAAAVARMEIGDKLEVILWNAAGYLSRVDEDAYKYTCKRGIPDDQRPYGRFTPAPVGSARYWDFEDEHFTLVTKLRDVKQRKMVVKR